MKKIPKIQKIKLQPATHFLKKDGTVAPVKKGKKAKELFGHRKVEFASPKKKRRDDPGASARADTLAAALKHGRLMREHEEKQAKTGTHKHAIDYRVADAEVASPDPKKMRCSEIPWGGGGDQCVLKWQHDGEHRYSGGPFPATEPPPRDERGRWDPRNAPTKQEPEPAKCSVGVPFCDVTLPHGHGHEWAPKKDGEHRIVPGWQPDGSFKPPADVPAAPVPGVVALLAVLDTTIERLEQRLASVLRPEDPAAMPTVSDSDIARRIEQMVIDLNEIISRVDI